MHRKTLYIFSLFLLFACGTAFSAEEKNNRFYFVQITDTHFGQLDNNERTRKIVDAINALPLEIVCVVHTGDMFNDNLADPKKFQAGKEILQKLKAPLMSVAGNHDIRRKTALEDARIFTTQFGALCKVKDYQGVEFITIFTEPLAQKLNVIDFDPLVTLGEQLELSRGKPVIVFHHTPSVESFFLNKMHPGWAEDIRTKWVGLLNKYNVKAVIAGHFHRDEMHWLGDVPLFVSSSVSARFSRQATYRIYEYNNGKVSYTTQYIK